MLHEQNHIVSSSGTSAIRHDQVLAAALQGPCPPAEHSGIGVEQGFGVCCSGGFKVYITSSIQVHFHHKSMGK